ncbi:MAG: hypothetical protein PUF00_06335 [Paraprevotella sp.]|nr:hypothetical protein [Paraprevotella sp.]
MQQKSFTVVLAIATLLSVSCTQDDLRRLSPKNSIIASIQSPSTRTAVDDSPTEGTGGTVSGIVWTKGDQLGVFEQTGASQTLYTKDGDEQEAKATFKSTSTITPYRAYYPYSESNNGRPWTSLLGNIPAVQPADEGNLSGDYKVGQANGGTSGNGYEFVFTHLFSLCRITLDASGTALIGDKLKSIDISVTGEEPICGDFTFNLRTLDWEKGEKVGNRISLTWDKHPTLTEKPITSYISLFPNVKEGDKITISVRTEKYTATFSANCKVNFERENIYNIPLTLDKYSSLKAYDNTGTFTACAFNVDGLPQKISFATINGDGPGSSGTTTMAGIANNLGWDIIAASEDFEYNRELVAALTNYSHGTWRGTVTSAQLSQTADTDGLNFFWRTSTTSAAGETWVQYNDAEGGLTSGANTCIKKGFRHYVVTVDAKNNVVIDVYITHMNTYSGSGNTESNKYVKAVLSQLRQLRDYVLKNAKANKRPAVIMGDTNMRYTRHDIKTNFLDVVAAYDNNAGYTVSDPWVEFHRGGVYPQWNSLSLMTRFAFAGDTENDIVCADNQKGEVVDKIWYINVPGAEVQLKATAHQNDVDNFSKSTSSVSYSGVMVEDANGSNTSGNTKYNSGQSISYTKDVGYSDHFPVVTTFEWNRTMPAAQ